MKQVFFIMVSIMLAVFLQANSHAGVAWKCSVSGKVLSSPIAYRDKDLDQNRVKFLFEGLSIPQKEYDFCSDWVGRTAEIDISHSYYDVIGRPKSGQLVLLTETKEENDFGLGLMVIRYFGNDLF